jgi:hypothetical protein
MAPKAIEAMNRDIGQYQQQQAMAQSQQDSGYAL